MRQGDVFRCSDLGKILQCDVRYVPTLDTLLSQDAQQYFRIVPHFVLRNDQRATRNPRRKYLLERNVKAQRSKLQSARLRFGSVTLDLPGDEVRKCDVSNRHALRTAR